MLAVEWLLKAFPPVSYHGSSVDLDRTFPLEDGVEEKGKKLNRA
jgi:hypothetical protein